jgi:hypothetical protein
MAYLAHQRFPKAVYGPAQETSAVLGSITLRHTLSQQPVSVGMAENGCWGHATDGAAQQCGLGVIAYPHTHGGHLPSQSAARRCSERVGRSRL